MASRGGVKSFESIEDLIADVQESRKALDRAVQDWQRALKPGDYAVMLFESGFDNFLIFYEILAEDPDDTPIDENCRLVRGYSVAEPEGEMGIVHVSLLDRQISAEVFHGCREFGWAIPLP